MITNEPADRTRVVLVDDDATVGDVVCRYLQNAGFAVDVVNDGRRRWSSCKTHRRTWSA